MGGAVIQEIKKKLNVEVSMPKVPADTVPGKKFKVGLAGGAKQVEEAKEVISSIIKYYQHEEMDIEQDMYKNIIGRGGSEMKHIQNNFHVKVYIPREHSETQKIVVVGLPADTERAKTYIEKLVFEAANRPAPRERQEQGDGDTRNDEEPTEKWMEGYLVKRS